MITIIIINVNQSKVNMSHSTQSQCLFRPFIRWGTCSAHQNRKLLWHCVKNWLAITFTVTFVTLMIGSRLAGLPLDFNKWPNLFFLSFFFMLSNSLMSEFSTSTIISLNSINMHFLDSTLCADYHKLFHGGNSWTKKHYIVCTRICTSVAKWHHNPLI